jgi:hypothetical protein
LTASGGHLAILFERFTHGLACPALELSSVRCRRSSKRANSARPCLPKLLSSGTVARNAATTIVLSGNGAQLGNNGGTFQLLDPTGVIKDVKTYSGANAQQGRIVVF